VTTAAELRDVLQRVPTGVSVVTVTSGAQRIGLTVATLVSLSLDPPLVGVAISRQAAAHELLRDARACAISILAADQVDLAEHFARGVPPIAMWEGVAVVDGQDPPVLADAVGWLEGSLRDELAAGTHTLFVLHVRRARAGRQVAPLVRVGGAFR
jgi:flavin reductase (DIM6/NTAB) family NADH-FMN oxidoreductase RutF